MELEMINKLFLELSQFATATTAREFELQRRIAELESRPSCGTDGGVPEGFVMVPAKPTSDQLIAGAKTMFRSHGTQNGVVGEVYAAMLAAKAKGG